MTFSVTIVSPMPGTANYCFAQRSTSSGYRHVSRAGPGIQVLAATVAVTGGRAHR
jgi:threonine/homoserine/homoserine lactone efflux protein